MPATHDRILTRSERIYATLRNNCYEFLCCIACEGVICYAVAQACYYFVAICGFVAIEKKRIYYIFPLSLILSIAATAWLAIEITVIFSPLNLFHELNNCQILNISAEIGSISPCTADISYSWIPHGFNATLTEIRLLSVETVVFHSIADDNVTICENAIQSTIHEIPVDAKCFLLSELYIGYRAAFNCAETVFDPRGVSKCFTLFEPQSLHEINVFASVLVAVALLLLLCPPIGIVVLLLTVPDS